MNFLSGIRGPRARFARHRRRCKRYLRGLCLSLNSISFRGGRLKDTKVVKTVCPICEGTRRCHLHGEFDEQYDDLSSLFGETRGAVWRLLQCAGCEHTFVEVTKYRLTQDELAIPETIEEKVWPALTKRRAPKWIRSVTSGNHSTPVFRRATYELYKTFNEGLLLSCSICVRTCFEIAVEMLGLDPEMPFAKKVDELEATGRVTKADADQIKVMIDAGNAAAHRGWSPESDEVELLINILERFLHAAWVQPKETQQIESRIAQLKDAVPKRKLRESKPDTRQLPHLSIVDAPSASHQSSAPAAGSAHLSRSRSAPTDAPGELSPDHPPAGE
nr:DUF4145 domain-containing protein [Cereibacter sphaeroides f. sp. denitrificans]